MLTEGLEAGVVVVGAAAGEGTAPGVPELGVAVGVEFPGRAWATTAERTATPATDPATSQRVTRETRRRPESRPAAPALMAEALSRRRQGVVELPPGFQTGGVGRPRPVP